MFRSFVVKLLMGAAIPLCIMFISGIALYHALQKSLEAGDEIAKEQAIIAAAHSLTLKFLEAESGERGFFITGKESFLVPYKQALTAFQLIHGRLEEMLVDQPRQLARLVEVKELFEQWHTDVAIPSIEGRRSGEDSTRITYFEKGKRLVDSFRALMADLTESADYRLRKTQRQSMIIARNANLIAVIGFGSAVLVALILWLMLANRTSLAVSSMSQAAHRIMEGKLSYRAPEVGRDELALMARSFNQMAVRLEALVRSEQEARRSLSEKVENMVANRTKELLAMNDMMKLLQSCQIFTEATQVTHALLPKLFLGLTGSLLLRANQGDALQIAVQWGHQLQLPEREYADKDCWAIRRGRPHQCEIVDPDRDLICPHIAPMLGSHLCVPLIAQGTNFGVLHIGLEGNAGKDWENWKQYALIVAEQLATRLANLNLRESLERQSVRDPLTGLYNRRYLEETIHRECGRAEREQSPLSLIMLDLDHFKDINDNYGHSVGDQVLIAVARLLIENLRGEDLVCRFGGEEFIIILPGTDEVVARQRAEALRKAILAARTAVGVKVALEITASFGVATFPHHAQTSESLIGVADNALYNAKNSGRNQVISASSLLVS